MNPRFSLLSTVIYLTTSLIFSPLLSNAVEGLEILGPKLNGVCQILVMGPDEKVLENCSGILKSKNEVVTDGHCIYGKPVEKLVVNCGYEESEDPPIFVGNIRTNSKFKESFISTQATIDSKYAISTILDRAVITLPRNSKLIPIPITQELSSFFDSTKSEAFPLKPGVECLISGFGRAFDGRGGVLHSSKTSNLHFESGKIVRAEEWKVDPSMEPSVAALACEYPDGSSEMFDQYIKVANNLIDIGVLDSTILVGDSGGPLLCRKDKKSPWTALGSALNYRPYIDGKMMKYRQVWNKFYFDSLVPFPIPQ